MTVDSIMTGGEGAGSGDTGASGVSGGDNNSQQSTQQNANGSGQQGTNQNQGGDNGTANGSGDNNGLPWYSGLPPETHEALKGFGKVDDLVKAYTDAQGKIPKVPTDTKEYDLSGVPANQADAVGKAFMEAGLTKDQAAKVLGLQSGLTKTAVESAMVNGANALRQEWGQDFDKNVNDANAAVKRFVPPELLQFWQKTGQANNPLLVKMFLGIKNAMSEDTLATGDNGSGNGSRKPADILYPNQGK